MTKRDDIQIEFSNFFNMSNILHIITVSPKTAIDISELYFKITYYIND